MIALLLVVICMAFISLGLPDSMLGAGAVDAGLNNFAVLQFSERNMSWLHCFWGIGATTLVPPTHELIMGALGIQLYPVFILILLVVMFVSSEGVQKS